MNWLNFKQSKKQYAIITLFLLIFAAFAIPSGIHFRNSYQHLSASCQSTVCDSGELRDTIFKSQFDGLVTNAIKLSILALPFVFGLFLGAPLIAKEYAENTNKLVWTQGISRTKWLTSKIGWLLAGTIVYAGLFTVIATWFSRTGNVVSHDRFNPLAFSSQAMVPVAAAVFAVSLGAMLGTWFKRLLPAIGLTLGILVMSQVAFPLLARPHYLQPSVYKTMSLMTENNTDPSRPPALQDAGAWVISEKMVNANGQAFEWSNPPSSCRVADPTTAKKDGSSLRRSLIGRNNVFVDVNCLNSLGYHWEVTYQPSYRYWNFQRIEFAIYLGLSVIAVAWTYRLIVKRDA